MELPAYIEQLGDEAFAAKFGVEVRTAQSWRRVERRPRHEKAQEIIQATDSKVTYAGIYSPDIKPRFLISESKRVNG